MCLVISSLFAIPCLKQRMHTSCVWTVGWFKLARRLPARSTQLSFSFNFIFELNKNGKSIHNTIEIRIMVILQIIFYVRKWIVLSFKICKHVHLFQCNFQIHNIFYCVDVVFKSLGLSSPTSKMFRTFQKSLE